MKDRPLLHWLLTGRVSAEEKTPNSLRDESHGLFEPGLDGPLGLVYDHGRRKTRKEYDHVLGKTEVNWRKISFKISRWGIISGTFFPLSLGTMDPHSAITSR